jgi:hypothetical protein
MYIHTIRQFSTLYGEQKTFFAMNETIHPSTRRVIFQLMDELIVEERMIPLLPR